MRPATLATLLLATALAAALPAAAQQPPDKVRLDDFALPPDAPVLAVDQLPGTTDAEPEASSPAGDRELAIPAPPRQARQPLPQLSSPGEGGAAPQLSATAQSREFGVGSVSPASDSRPQPATRLVGADRCDPQPEAAQLERCRRILELRAAEFSAVEAPRLSPEQEILASRGEDAETLAAGSSRMRVELASGNDPDADDSSNQELAAIYLYRRDAPDQPDRPEEPSPETDRPVVQALQALQIIAP